MPINPYETYKQQSVLTMTPGEMLNKLYDELIKQLSIAQLALEQQELEKVNVSLQKSQRILNYLRSTLNFQYEVSANLELLYEFFIHQIVNANIKKDASFIQEILPMVQELQQTFLQADKLAKKS